MVQPSKKLAEAHYAPIKGSAAFDEKVDFLTSGPAIATVWEAANAVAGALATAGDAEPSKAAQGSAQI